MLQSSPRPWPIVIRQSSPPKKQDSSRIKLADEAELILSESDSESASSEEEPENIDQRSLPRSSEDNEIRLRVENNNAPISISLDGDMEGRILRMVPAENGMTDIVISGGRDRIESANVTYPHHVSLQHMETTTNDSTHTRSLVSTKQLLGEKRNSRAAIAQDKHSSYSEPFDGSSYEPVVEERNARRVSSQKLRSEIGKRQSTDAAPIETKKTVRFAGESKDTLVESTVRAKERKRITEAGLSQDKRRLRQESSAYDRGRLFYHLRSGYKDARNHDAPVVSTNQEAYSSIDVDARKQPVITDRTKINNVAGPMHQMLSVSKQCEKPAFDAQKARARSRFPPELSYEHFPELGTVLNARAGPYTSRPTYAQVVEQGTAIANANITKNRGTQGFTRPRTAQSGYPAHQDARISSSSDYMNGEIMQSTSNMSLYFKDDFLTRYSEQDFPHNTIASKRSPILTPFTLVESEIQRELHNDDAPWSTVNLRQDQDLMTPVVSQLQNMQRVSFETPQLNGAGSVASCTADSSMPLFENEQKELREVEQMRQAKKSKAKKAVRRMGFVPTKYGFNEDDKSVGTRGIVSLGTRRGLLENAITENPVSEISQGMPKIEAENIHETAHVSEATSDPAVFLGANNNEQAGLIRTDSLGDSDDEIDRYQNDKSASCSNAPSPASVFSIEFLASSAGDLSRNDVYSAIQIASAAKVLISVLREDDSLLQLYRNAIDNPDIGPERLRMNLRSLLRNYSIQSKILSNWRLESLAAQLVDRESALIANSIVEKLQTAQATPWILEDQHRDEGSDKEKYRNIAAFPMDEEGIEHLVAFRQYLVNSKAFLMLQASLEDMTMRKPRGILFAKSTPMADYSAIENKKSPKNDTAQMCPAKTAARPIRSLTWENWIEDVTQTVDGLLRNPNEMTAVKANLAFLLFADALMLATDGILIALGQLELGLRPGMTRLRWRCKSCGDSLYSDVVELRAGGVSELTSHMQRTLGTKVQVASYNQQASGQKYIFPQPVQWIHNAVRKLRAVLGRPTQPSTCLPLNNTQCHANGSSAPNNQPPRQDILHLLACMHRNRNRICLKQDRIEDVATDRTLVCFLRRQYMRHRGRIRHMMSLKSIKGLLFVKFWLPIGGSVSILHHERCCVAASSASMTCECIPPPPKVEPSPGAEYRCIPGPPATYPPIPPEYLSSLITCPADVHEKDTWILDQLPKRTCGELQGQIGKPAEGWGVYYQEGWDRDIIGLVILVVLIAASLLFGILWSRYQIDVQGAFGVSAYIMAVCAVLLHVLSNLADKMG